MQAKVTDFHEIIDSNSKAAESPVAETRAWGADAASECRRCNGSPLPALPPFVSAIEEREERRRRILEQRKHAAEVAAANPEGGPSRSASQVSVNMTNHATLAFASD